MDKITRILEKLNQGREQQPLTLADLIPLSLAEVRNIAGAIYPVKNHKYFTTRQ